MPVALVLNAQLWPPPVEHFLTQQGTAAWGEHPAEIDRRVGPHAPEQQSAAETERRQTTTRPLTCDGLCACT